MKQINYQAGFDLALIMVLLVAVKQAVLPSSYLYAGPTSTFTAMIVATILLRRRGLTWVDLGLRWPEKWSQTALLTALVFFTIVFSGAAMNWFAGLFFEDMGTQGRFDHVEGNLSAYLIILCLVWTHGSFFEELLFRAFIINRGTTMLGSGTKVAVVAAVFASIFFGYRHYYYQGMKGALVTGTIGLGLSLLYIWFGKKNIMPLVLGHGLVNTIAQTQRYLGPTLD